MESDSQMKTRAWKRSKLNLESVRRQKTTASTKTRKKTKIKVLH
jgi:hypothetical protein